MTIAGADCRHRGRSARPPRPQTARRCRGRGSPAAESGFGGHLQRGPTPPSVCCGGHPDQHVDRILGDGDCPVNPRGSAMARRTTVRMSSRPSSCGCRISDRDSSGATTEKDGFSVVAATGAETTLFSTAASRASCWVLENRCTSSMNRTVWLPCTAARQTSSMTARTSLTPAVSAEGASNRRPVECDISEARVVFRFRADRRGSPMPHRSLRRGGATARPRPAGAAGRPPRRAWPGASGPPAVR